MTGLRRRLASWVRRAAEDRAHLEEVEFHVQMAVERHQANGLSLPEARRRAALEFGSRVDAREAARDARSGSVIDDAWRDLRHGARALASHPVFTAAIVATLGLAIGAATTVFSVADHVLLRASPYRDAASLVVAWETDRRSGTTREPAALPDWRDLQRRMRSLASLEAGMGAVGTLTVPGNDPQRVSAMLVSPGWFPALGVSPVRGRAFLTSEGMPGGGAVALISESLWRGRFRGADEVLGTRIVLNDVPTEVVGVVPDAADYGLDQVHDRAAYHATWESAGRVDVWLPLQATEAELSRDTHPLLLVGRLAPGRTPTMAAEEMTAIMARLEADYPRSNTGRGGFVEPFRDVVDGPARPLMAALSGAVLLLALVAAVNVANLLLVRAGARAREVALRTALGATAARLARQFAVEAGLLVAAGAVAGLVAAAFAIRVVRAIAPGDLPRIDEVTLDARSVAAAIVLAGIVGAICSLLPAWQARRDDVVTALKGESGNATSGRGGHRVRMGLVLAQLVLSVALATCAGLVVRSFRAVLAVDPGFEAAAVVKLQYELPASRYPRDFSRFPNFTEISQFTDRVLAGARGITGVEAATISGAHPLDEGFTNSWSVVGREAEARDWPEISVRTVSAGYDQTMGQRLIEGRGVAASDDASAPPVAVLNATAAMRFFPTGTPIGQELSFWGIRRRIVGVVADERIHGVDRPAPAAVYVPLSQAPGSSGVLMVRSRRSSDALLAEMQRVVTAVDPQLAVFGGEPLSRTVAASQGQRRFAVLLMGAFAVLTVLLALVGVHGVVAHGAQLRAREVGIRLALGARPGAVAGHLLRGVLSVALAGAILGALVALAGGRLLASLLYGVGAQDPLTLVVVPLAVIAVALVAAAWPAWRGVRRAPMASMRG